MLGEASSAPEDPRGDVSLCDILGKTRAGYNTNGVTRVEGVQFRTVCAQSGRYIVTAGLSTSSLENTTQLLLHRFVKKEGTNNYVFSDKRSPC